MLNMGLWPESSLSMLHQMRPNGSAQRYYTPVKVTSRRSASTTTTHEDVSPRNIGEHVNKIRQIRLHKSVSESIYEISLQRKPAVHCLHVPTRLSRIDLVLPTGYPIAELGNFHFSAYEELQRNIDINSNNGELTEIAPYSQVKNDHRQLSERSLHS